MYYSIELVDKIIWPLTILIISFSFKEQFTSLINNIKSVEFASIKTEFNHGLEKIEQISEATATGGSAGYEFDSKALQLQKLAKLSPNGSVVDAWREVELASISAALHNGLPVRGPKGRVSGNAAVKELVNAGIIDQKMSSVYTQLKELRNQAAHPEGKVSYDQANKYTLAALEIAAQFREIKSVSLNNTNS